jgi:DNA topoisomerase-1
MDRVDAQQARRALDRLVGYKISPLLWAKVRKGLSAGRVQSVATRLVVERENEINDFIPEEYWDIVARAVIPGAKGKKNTFQLKLGSLNGEKAVLDNEQKAMEAKAMVESQEFHVTSIKKGEKKKTPAPPFTTSSLQQEAGRKLNFTTQKTMQVVQQLYEGVDLQGEGTQGLVTYIRTDSVRVSDEAVNAARSFIAEKYGERYIPETPHVYKGRSNAQDAHEAIRPTDVNLIPDRIKDSLTPQQYRLYKLIWSRFVACQMANKTLDVTTVEITANDYLFKLTHNKVVFDGYAKLYSESKDEEDTPSKGIPDMQKGDVLPFLDLLTEQKFTQPPARYTDDTLIKAMEDKGIGRPSTYAPTIATVISRDYAEREKKILSPTPLGETVNQVMTENFKDIVNVKFTAAMEDNLEKVADGEVEWVEVIRDFYGDFAKTLAQADKKFEGVKIKVPEEVTDIICEKCGRNMVIRNGKNGKFLACPGFPQCRNTKSILVETEGNCPLCGGRIVERKTRKGKTYYACEKGKDCGFMTWDKPLAETCPNCGQSLFREMRRGGKIHCLKDGCGFEKQPEKKNED